MKLYVSIIGIAMLAIASINIAFETASAHYIIIALIWCVALQFALDGLLAIFINKMPDKWFDVDNNLYRVTENEIRFYKKLGVRSWKEKVWELGWLGGFSKKKLKEPNNPSYVERFIVECNKGVMTHRLSYPIGFLAMLTLPNGCALTIALPVAAVNLFLNVLPTIVLRYNTPMLKKVLKRLERKQGVENFGDNLENG